MPYKDQLIFLKKFPEPKDDFEMSFFKYQCFCKYCYFGKKWLLLFYNLGAMFLLPIMYVKLKRKGNEQVETVARYDAVIENITRLPNDDILPDEISSSYKNNIEITEINYGNAFLSNTTINICKELKNRYFHHFYFRLIVLIKLAQFNEYIHKYNPKAIVFYSCEREFASPLQTLMCETEGVEYISYMHGDYISTLSFAFQKYSKYYIWDKAYKSMFENLRCDFPMYIYKPLKLRGIAVKQDDRDCEYFASYYFSNEKRSSVEKIYSIFRKFESYGLRCKIRPHPRFSDIEMLKEVFKDIMIEDTITYFLADSVTDSLFIVGLHTTVLSQAFFSGKKVVIDDVSNRDEFLELRDRNYIMIKRPHIVLSELEDSVEIDFPNKEEYQFFHASKTESI